MKKFFKGVGIYLLVFMLFACSTEQTNMKSSEETTEKALKQSFKEPSKLSLITSDGIYTTIRGAYSWSVLNKKTNESITTMVDIEGPLNLVKLDDALPLSVDTEIEMEFQFAPNNVLINVWHQNGTSVTYNTFQEIVERGAYVVEFVAEFKQGTVTYVNAFNLK